MSVSQKVFLDSSFFLGFIDRTHLEYPKAAGIMEYLANEHFHVYTSSLVLQQVYHLLERDFSPIIALEFLQAILESNIEVLYLTRAELLSVYRLFKATSSSNLPLSEALSATLMQKRGINSVLTFDPWRNLLGTQVSLLISGR